MCRAVCRAAERLDISDELLAAVLGIAPSLVTRMNAGTYLLNKNLQEWTSALLFIRLFHSLNSVVPDESTAGRWLNSENLGLNGKPINLFFPTKVCCVWFNILNLHERSFNHCLSKLDGIKNT